MLSDKFSQEKKEDSRTVKFLPPHECDKLGKEKEKFQKNIKKIRPIRQYP